MDTTKKDPERGKKYKYSSGHTYIGPLNIFSCQTTTCSFRLSHFTSFVLKKLTWTLPKKDLTVRQCSCHGFVKLPSRSRLTVVSGSCQAVEMQLSNCYQAEVRPSCSCDVLVRQSSRSRLAVILGSALMRQLFQEVMRQLKCSDQRLIRLTFDCQAVVMAPSGSHKAVALQLFLAVFRQIVLR